MGLFSISKKNKKNNNQKFINTNMIPDPDQQPETFVYQTIDNQNMNMNNDYNPNFANQQNYYQEQMPNNYPDNYSNQMPQNNYPENYSNYNYPNNYPENQQQVMPNVNETYPQEDNQQPIEVMEDYYPDNESLQNTSNQELEGQPMVETLQQVPETNETPAEPEESEVLDEIEEPKPDPLNNANNPIPVNPTAPKEEKETEEIFEEASVNPFVIIGIILGMILRPGTTIVNNTKKYRRAGKGIAILIWITLISLVVCIVTRLITGAFIRTFNSVTGTYSISLNFANILNFNDYPQYLLIAFFISFVAILIISVLFYATSFFNSKGVHFGSYLVIANLGMIPTIIGVVVLSPLLAIISDYLSILVILVAVIYSIICFIVGTNSILKFKNTNSQIFYNALNLSLLAIIMLGLFILGIHANVIALPNISL